MIDWLIDWLINWVLHSQSTKNENIEDAATTEPQEFHLSPLPAGKRHNESNEAQNESSSATDA